MATAMRISLLNIEKQEVKISRADSREPLPFSRILLKQLGLEEDNLIPVRLQ